MSQTCYDDVTLHRGAAVEALLSTLQFILLLPDFIPPLFAQVDDMKHLVFEDLQGWISVDGKELEQYCTKSFNSAVTGHRPSRFDERSQGLQQNRQKSAPKPPKIGRGTLKSLQILPYMVI